MAGVIYLNTNQKSDKDTEVSKKETTEATTEETTEKITEESTDVVVESTTENTTSEPVATTTEPVDEESEDVLAYPNGGQDNANGTVFISFEGKSADEIKENIIEISRTTKDATPENFAERCMVYPIDYSYSDEADEMIFYYWYLRLQEGAEGIDHANVYIVRNDDGSLNMASRASVILTCQNRERWEELYNTSCDALMQITGCNSLMTSGSGDDEASHYLTYFVAKDFDENGNFKLHVEIPLIDPEEPDEA